jgi:patatin-like phospholipase/acyl hydrolase
MAKAFRILAIDGGGMLGIYSAAMIEAIEKHYKKKATDHFDLIVGTSAGAIIACGLACGLSGGDMRDFFASKGPAIFGNNIEGSFIDWLRKIKQIFFSSKHNNKRLLEEYKVLYGDRKFRDAPCYLCINTFNVSKGRTRIFKTPHNKKHLQLREIPFWKAVACSSAAPTYLPEYFPGFDNESDDGYTDGGVWANNPSIIGLIEAKKYFLKRGQKVVILSVASYLEGIKRKDRLNSFLNWGLDIINVFMTAQSASSEYMARQITGNEGHPYMRMEPDVTQEMGKVCTVDNTKKELLETMVKQAGSDFVKYMEKKHYKNNLDMIFKTKKTTNPKF